MANYGEPQWTTPSSPGASSFPDVSPGDFTSTSSRENAGLTSSEARAEKQSMVQGALSILNILICALMIYLGVSGIMDLEISLDTVSELCIIIYMFVFSGLLLSYEFMWWKSIKSYNKLLRKNFGFMYGMRGKAGFLIFVAFLCLGLEAMPNLAFLMWSTGIVWATSGVLHIFVSFWRPNLVSNYEAPTAGWTDGTDPV